MLLLICTSTYVKSWSPRLVRGVGVLHKAAVVGERLSPWVALALAVSGARLLMYG